MNDKWFEVRVRTLLPGNPDNVEDLDFADAFRWVIRGERFSIEQEALGYMHAEGQLSTNSLMVVECREVSRWEPGAEEYGV